MNILYNYILKGKIISEQPDVLLCTPYLKKYHSVHSAWLCYHMSTCSQGMGELLNIYCGCMAILVRVIL